MNTENLTTHPQPVKFPGVRTHVASFPYLVEAELDREWERRHRQVSDHSAADAILPEEGTS